MNTIPDADISAFTNNSDFDTRRAAAKKFAAALKLHGCAAVTGHGLPESDLQEMFATMQKLFDLPTSEKMKAPHPAGMMPHRGYLAKMTENSGKLGAVYTNSESEKDFLKSALDWKVDAAEVGKQSKGGVDDV